MALPDGSGQIRSQMRSIRYTYDSMSRLLSETEGGRVDRYSYDLCGNRLEKVSGCERESYVYNSKNQLTERRDGTGSWRYEFDSQGNLLKESGPKETLRYEYNPRNQQSKVHLGECCIQENLYDGENLRAGMIEHGKRRTFLFMNREIVAELNASDTPESRFIRGYGAAALEHNGKQYGIHHDEQLSTGWITGADGTVENAYEYDAFGNLLRSQGNVPNRLLYGGQQYDPEVGQYYLRARYYNPVVGRFTQEDPYRGDGLNLYAYCANNPVTYSDPSGYACSFNAQAEENAVRENATLQADEAGGTQGNVEGGSGAGIPSGYYQDTTGSWNRPNGEFASNAEVGITSPANVSSGSHGNSLSDTRTNYGYALVDRDTNEILKFGETLYPDTRYSQKYLDANNAKMMIIEEGSKLDIHLWQHDMNEYYFYKYHEYPPKNSGGW